VRPKDDRPYYGPRNIAVNICDSVVQFGYPGHPMQRTLNDHILRLRLKSQELRDKLTGTSLPVKEQARIKSELRDAELALGHFLKAFEIEQRLHV
jgi:hypothetical protein